MMFGLHLSLSRIVTDSREARTKTYQRYIVGWIGVFQRPGVKEMISFGVQRVDLRRRDRWLLIPQRDSETDHKTRNHRQRRN